MVGGMCLTAPARGPGEPCRKPVFLALACAHIDGLSVQGVAGPEHVALPALPRS